MVIQGIKPEGRRIQLVRVTAEVLLELFKQPDPITLSFSGIPDDAKLVTIIANPVYNSFFLAIESDEFPKMQPGHALVEMDVRITRHYGAPR